MFASRKERRSWSELTRSEIVIQLVVLGLITTPLILLGIHKGLFDGNGIEWFYFSFAGVVLFGAGSVVRGAVGELWQRRNQEKVKSNDSNDDHL